MNSPKSVVSDFDKANVDAIVAGNGDWFTAQLMRLYLKADHWNRLRLKVGFPEVAELMEHWENA